MQIIVTEEGKSAYVRNFLSYLLYFSIASENHYIVVETLLAFYDTIKKDTRRRPDDICIT